jgi:hypothetical protein
MFDSTSLGKWLVLAGLIVAAVGVGFWVVGRLGLPLGRLPGDLRFEGKNFSIYIPIATSILLSVGLTVLINLIIRLFRR